MILLLFFVLHLCRYLDEFKTEKSFVSCLHDKDKGRCYRTYAGISDDRITCEADFSNFKKQIGVRKLDEIFHLLVEIVKRVGLITGKILSYDVTLFPTFANYRGCNYACKECKSIPLKEDFLKSLRYRIIDSLNRLYLMQPNSKTCVFVTSGRNKVSLQKQPNLTMMVR